METKNMLKLSIYPQENALGDTSEIDMQAQNFNYAQEVPKPNVDRVTNIFSVLTNMRDSMDYAKGMLSDGKDCRQKDLTMGNAYFMASGTCDMEESDPQCRGETRYIYIDNIPKPYPACADPNQPIDQQCAKNQSTGIIPGMLMDVAQMNPMEFFASLAGKGSFVSDKCVLRTEPVGWKRGTQSRFYNETRCSAPKKPLVCNIDFFEDYNNSEKQNKTGELNGMTLLQNSLLAAVVGCVLYKTYATVGK